VERNLKKRGAEILKGAKAQGVTKNKDSLSVSVLMGGETKTVECDVLLVAVGMKPRSRGIGLEEIGVAIDARGFVTTDERCATNVPGVYAIGDVSGLRASPPPRTG
jgi:dihydrolipoamide dehydrogenase